MSTHSSVTSRNCYRPQHRSVLFISQAIRSQQVPQSLTFLEIRPVSHSRWLTTSLLQDLDLQTQIERKDIEEFEVNY